MHCLRLSWLPSLGLPLRGLALAIVHYGGFNLIVMMEMQILVLLKIAPNVASSNATAALVDGEISFVINGSVLVRLNSLTRKQLVYSRLGPTFISQG